MKTLFILGGILFWLTAFDTAAQQKDSSKVSSDSLPKTPSDFVKSIPTNQFKQTTIDLKTPTKKKQQSEYIYEKGQITGGRTTWKLGKKKKQ